MDSNKFFVFGTIVGSIASFISIVQHVNATPTPRCPTCRATQYVPGAKQSRCHNCGQLIKWTVPGRRPA